MTAEARGWGPAGCTRDQLTRVRVPGMVDSRPYFPLNVRVEVAPLFEELCRWLVAERARHGRPPLTCSGGYNKRLVRGSTTTWSEHSWGLAGDFCVATNPMQRTLRTDMPPGTSAKAKSLGMRWGGDYRGRKDPMHFEFMGTPADAARLVAQLRPPALQTTPAPPTSVQEDDSMTFICDDGVKTYLRDGGDTVHLAEPKDVTVFLAAGARDLRGKLSKATVQHLAEAGQ